MDAEILPQFQLNQVGFSYRPGKPVLSGISLSIRAGEFVAVIGPNGAGKSTLVGLLSGRLHAVEGTVQFCGTDTSRWARKAFARKVAVVPQREEPAFDFTVRELVLMGRFPYQSGFFGLESGEDYAIVDDALSRMDLSEFANRPIGALSGGERQRVLVARAIAQTPSVLLLDEPNSALDPQYQKRVLDLALKWNKDKGTTVVLVTHDLSLVGAYACRVLVVDGQTVSRDGSAADVIETDYLSRLYHTRIGVERKEDGSVLVGLLR